MSLSAANGLPLEVMGFIELAITLGDSTHRIDALAILSLGPDSIYYLIMRLCLVLVRFLTGKINV